MILGKVVLGKFKIFGGGGGKFGGSFEIVDELIEAEPPVNYSGVVGVEIQSVVESRFGLIRIAVSRHISGNDLVVRSEIVGKAQQVEVSMVDGVNDERFDKAIGLGFWRRSGWFSIDLV